MSRHHDDDQQRTTCLRAPNGSIALATPAGRIDLRLEDYRDLRGHFDKIVSIEMFEAVGLAHYDDFFSACDRLLNPDGAMLLQTITVDDWRFQDYLSSPSWIAKRIFPGAELASVAEILASLARVSRLGLWHARTDRPALRADAAAVARAIHGAP